MKYLILITSLLMIGCTDKAAEVKTHYLLIRCTYKQCALMVRLSDFGLCNKLSTLFVERAEEPSVYFCMKADK